MTIRQWEHKRILITVKSYPRPSQTHGETVCVAGITDDGQWIRLYPVTYRDLPKDQQFSKWDWIEASVTKSKLDYRPESYVADPTTIRRIAHVGTKRHWEERRRLVLPHLDQSLEHLKTTNRSLGLIKAKVTDFIMEPDDTDWSPEKKAALRQRTFFTRREGVLEKVPFTFKYRFTCPNHSCPGHTATIVDWEVYQAYRTWRHLYGQNVGEAMRAKFLTELAEQRDLYLFVGTALKQDRYRVFLVIGLFYPPIVSQVIQPRFEWQLTP